MKYQIKAPEQKVWNEKERRWEDTLPYDSTVTPNRTVFGVQIIAGQADTDDPFKAIELFDMGYAVTPDPHPEAQAIIEERSVKQEAKVKRATRTRAKKVEELVEA